MARKLEINRQKQRVKKKNYLVRDYKFHFHHIFLEIISVKSDNTFITASYSRLGEIVKYYVMYCRLVSVSKPKL